MLLLLALALLALPQAARAVSLTLHDGLCYAIVPNDTPIEQPPASAFACDGRARDYTQRILLLRVDPAQHGIDPTDMALLFRVTRFERLTVQYSYADGSSEQQSVRRGDFGSRWRTGNQISFSPSRQVPVREIRIAYRGLASDRLARVRILSRVAATRDLALAAAATSWALTLLLIGAIYNVSLALAVRRQFLAWQALWASLVMTWGMVWSQLVLIALPSLAGTTTSRMGTLLSSVALTAATMSVVTALGDAMTPRWRRIVAAVGFAAPIVGVTASFLHGTVFSYSFILMDAICLIDVVLVAGALALAWRAGNGEARDLTLAWVTPMVVFGLTSMIDFGTSLFGGGAQLAVLTASAVQTVILSITATRRFSRMRVELDAARAAETVLAELANRDPLTGLLNRRGFIERSNATFDGGNTASFGLLLIDVDKFKGINDRFGHEVGDTVLCRIAARLHLLERELCIAGRLGGEEFVVGISGLNSIALEEFADHIRRELGAIDHDAVTRQRRVTVSIGVAAGSTATPFQRLYGMADRALYDAKHAGRDRVVFHSDAGDRATRERLARDQRSFDW
ncbi:sensor domain-containing diguanylate cyclase [Sphingomonas nostoxanthinifaciens]|uniref:sensor domain-containing diguanylate cyclase n=1 Tax=Sphingomonas nostoxanthinifaciens TaxID=2872652 RepID=UPI001CC1F13B|nr:GGDEF domain-containing protein [Sphingomonas nostoxanthinifaciens]UAK23725.1 GGDEF domain-containing protein [Sphingomonas nostoxanthinifaciens]